MEEALPIARQIAEALEAGHEARVIHRDLKPANVKVKEDGMDKRVPLRAKLILPAAILYFISPIDIVSGIIPLHVWIDDILVILISIALFQTGEFDKGKAYMTRTTGHSWSLTAAYYCYISGETDLLTEVEAAARDALTPELAPIRAWEPQAALAQVAILG